MADRDIGNAYVLKLKEALAGFIDKRIAISLSKQADYLADRHARPEMRETAKREIGEALDQAYRKGCGRDI